tara:strand:- start:46 stop:738 length:693 start_codon:yes stop_codon:yes gene_type:complete
MAFKMAPKSPVLMATGKFGSPAKNMNKGYGPAKTSSPAKQRSTRGEDKMELKGEALRGGEPVPTKKGLKNMTKKDLKKVPSKKRKPTPVPISLKAEKIKFKDPKNDKPEALPIKAKTKDKPAPTTGKGRTRTKNKTEIITINPNGSKRIEIRKTKTRTRGNSPAKQAMQSGSSMTAAQKKAMKDKSVFGPDGKKVAKPPKNKKSLDKTGLTAGKDMTAAQKAKLKKYGKS